MIPQQAKSLMKFASSFGRYDEEWYDGDRKPPENGDVPCMTMLPSQHGRAQTVRTQTYSFWIQLFIEFPPQLIPAIRLPAALLSRRCCWRPALPIDIGMAPLVYCGVKPDMLIES